MLWFTSDTHFGHKNIIRHSNRPFATVEEMDDALIANWNAIVAKNDVVWHLGDFCWHPRELDRYLDRLNGQIHFIWGNHEYRSNSVTQSRRWASTQPYAEIKVDGHSVILCHYKFQVWNKHHHGSIHLYGHSHGSLPGDSQCCDVGVDAGWDYRPISFDQIQARFKQSSSHRFPDHHQPDTSENDAQVQGDDGCPPVDQIPT